MMMMMPVLAVPLAGGSFFLGSPVVVVVVFPDISLYFESSFTNK
jgi:hypothetical protein